MSKAQEYLSKLKQYQHGTCVSIFIPEGDIESRIRDLETSYFEIQSLIRKIMPAEEQKQFLRPLKDLIRSPDTAVKFKADLAIYRSHQFFKIISLPIPVSRTAVVATSFHVKPLLRWSQLDMDYFVLGINQEGAFLYRGGLEKVTQLSYYSRNRAQAEANMLGGTLAGHWSLWITRLLRNHNFPLFMIGDLDEIDLMQKKIEYQGQMIPPLAADFHLKKVEDYHAQIKQLLNQRDIMNQKKALFQFYSGFEDGQSIENLKDISREASTGNVKKLIISEDKMIWGKINRDTGKVRPHPMQLDHEDDDLLDDLAELVLAKDGEVILTSSELLPLGRPIVAMLKDSGPITSGYVHVR